MEIHSIFVSPYYELVYPCGTGLCVRSLRKVILNRVNLRIKLDD